MTGNGFQKTQTKMTMTVSTDPETAMLWQGVILEMSQKQTVL